MNPSRLRRGSTAGWRFRARSCASSVPAGCGPRAADPMPRAMASRGERGSCGSPLTRSVPLEMPSRPNSAAPSSLRPLPTRPAMPRTSPRRNWNDTSWSFVVVSFSAASTISPAGRRAARVEIRNSRPTIMRISSSTLAPLISTVPRSRHRAAPWRDPKCGGSRPSCAKRTRWTRRVA